jgi:hypothetical protein
VARETSIANVGFSSTVVVVEIFIDWLDQRKQRQALGSTPATLSVSAPVSLALSTRQTQAADLETARSSLAGTKSATVRVSIEPSMRGQVEGSQRTCGEKS